MWRPSLKTFSRTIFLITILFGPCQAGWGQAPPAESIFRQGTEALRAGKLDDAADAFTKVTQISPRFAEAYVNLGLVLEQQGKHADAIAALEKANSLKPGLRGANLFLGIAAYRLNKYDKAAEALQRETRGYPADAKAWMWLGVNELAAGRPEVAVDSLNRAYKLSPDDVDILYHRGRALLLLSRQTYEHMFRVDPNTWRVHQVLAEGYVESEHYEDAVREYQAALREAPQEPGLHQAVATQLWKIGKLDEAEQEYRTELKIDPDNALAIYQLGALLVDRSNPAAGRTLIADALQRDPNLPIANYYLGRADMELGHDDEAIADFKLILSQKPGIEVEQRTYYQLSRIYRRQHKTADADAALERFRTIEQALHQETTESLQRKREEQSGNPLPPLPPPGADADKP